MSETTITILYPKDQKLRKAYQGIIKLVLNERKIHFQPITIIKAVIDHLDMIDDSNFLTMKGAGPNYKKAKNIVRTLSGSFLIWSGQSSLEVYVFDTNKKRVSTFGELETLCYADSIMAEVIATNETLDLSQAWIDPISDPKKSPIRSPILEEIENIDRINLEKKLMIATHVPNRHCGVFKGSADPKAAKKVIHG